LINLKWFNKIVQERNTMLLNNNIIKPKKYITNIKN
jgi:hypothetical protein